MSLEALGIINRPYGRYYTFCPRCGNDRSKRAASLSVIKENDKAYIKCFHEGQCEWNKSFSIPLDGSEAVIEETDEIKLIYPVPADIKLPEFKNVILYPYKTIDGKLLGYIKRIETVDGKEIRPFFYSGDNTWVEKWPSNLITLYNAESLEDKLKPVLVVEGEKAVEAAKYKLPKFITVCWPLGASNVKKGNWDLLRNRDVFIWPDNDKPGFKAASEIANSLRANQIRILDVRHLPEGADIADDILDEDIKLAFKRSETFVPKAISLLTEQDFIQKISHFREGELFGWHSLDSKIRLPPSGLVIIQGRSKHGKSTFLYNLSVKKFLEGKKCFLYSYEIPADRVLVKLAMILEQKEFEPLPHDNYRTYVDKIKKGELEQFKILQSSLNKKFFIDDSPLLIDDLCKQLRHPFVSGSYVFIDYIQLIRTNTRDSRYLTIQDICNKLREVANENNLVIITAAQLTPNMESWQRDYVREGKDIDFVAELVLRVWNKQQGESDGIHAYKDRPGNFILKTILNRNGIPGNIFPLNLKYGAVLEDI